MNALEVIDTIHSSSKYSLTREVLSGVLIGYGWKLEHDEPGRYDPPPPHRHGSGFLVYKDPDSGRFIKFFLEEDSYNGGWLDYYYEVTPREETKVVYEPVTKTVRDWK
jgi:hypothetical protein